MRLPSNRDQGKLSSLIRREGAGRDLTMSILPGMLVRARTIGKLNYRLVSRHIWAHAGVTTILLFLPWRPLLP